MVSLHHALDRGSQNAGSPPSRMKDTKGPRLFAEHIDRHAIRDRDARHERRVCGHDAVEPLSLGQRL